MRKPKPLHPQALAVMQKYASLGLPSNTEVSDQQARINGNIGRAAFDLEEEHVARTSERSIQGSGGDLPIRIYEPNGDGPHPLVMLFHGGGWVAGDLDAEDTTCRGLSLRASAVVVSVDYRLAPETRFPGGLEDCYTATVWAVEHAADLNVEPSKLAVAGTSAGGNLAAVVALMARDRGGPKIAHQLLYCPITDYDLDRTSYIEFGSDYYLTRDTMAWFWDHYFGPDGDGLDPYASPLRAPSLAGLPDATVVTAECDPLLDEGFDYAKALEAAGVNTAYREYKGMFHGFNNRIGIIDAAKDALDFGAEQIVRSFSRV
ncbi:MAG: alpha/beta hydrolase [Chloroflexi bacterium]|nr:alpha/beta hydrolase [Chloroflexota bacterium]